MISERTISIPQDKEYVSLTGNSEIDTETLQEIKSFILQQEINHS